ncbi:pyridoxamine 5'-phosphate oxidase family protein [uncultured Azohydromonas sp.]|uniref:pyridoxamine 5'-phosphate oxidase family protein n=1 Tax=uncultured Azohydromonas sp. TaxID=487342 RepID=UPI00262C2192|nr:pyridoxamine 5'-phosphate oxidase family protein [uncultured Azohydromonas sp.]
MLTPEVIAYAQRSVLAWLATVDPAGCPNVSPKEIFTVVDERFFVIANIASPCSVRNLRANDRACLSFIDVFVQKGFKVKGRAEIIEPTHPDFPKWSVPLREMTRDQFPLRSVIVLHPEVVEPILAPSYTFFAAGTTEESQIAAAMRTYGVQPRQPGCT